MLRGKLAQGPQLWGRQDTAIQQKHIRRCPFSCVVQGHLRPGSAPNMNVMGGRDGGALELGLGSSYFPENLVTEVPS